MSREIKFRAFNKQDSKMHNDIESTYDWEFMPTDTCENKEWVLMQYTGLNDKNGKEIYEGDIIKKMIDENEWIFEVKFGQGAFVFRGMSSPMSGNFMNTKSKEFEVVGNIYQK